MEGAFIFSNKAVKASNINLQEWLGEASKEEQIEMARQIADTVDKSDDEISYIDTANLEDMQREERMGIDRNIVSSILHDWGYTSC